MKLTNAEGLRSIVHDLKKAKEKVDSSCAILDKVSKHRLIGIDKPKKVTEKIHNYHIVITTALVEKVQRLEGVKTND